MSDDRYVKAALAVAREVVGSRPAEVRLSTPENRADARIDVLPANPSACGVSIFPMGHQIDLLLGPDGVLHELWQKRHEERLHNLRRCLTAVITGGYEERWHQKRLPWPHTQLVGTFHTEQGDIVFKHQGGEPEGLELERRYEPY